MTGSQTCLPKQRRRKFLCDRPMVAKTSLSALDLSALKVRAPAGAQHSSHRVAAAAYLWQAEFPHLLSEATEARRFLCILLWMLLLHLFAMHLHPWPCRLHSSNLFGLCEQAGGQVRSLRLS